MFHLHDTLCSLASLQDPEEWVYPTVPIARRLVVYIPRVHAPRRPASMRKFVR
jgi:hypothetical protein